MNTVKFVSRGSMKKILENQNLGDNSFVVSINDTDDEVSEMVELLMGSGVGGAYFAKFTDDEVSFDEEEASQMIRTFEDMNETGIDEVIVHCFLGVSRSAAIAKFINDFYSRNKDEMYDSYKVYNRRVYSVLEKVYNREINGLTNTWDEI